MESVCWQSAAERDKDQQTGEARVEEEGRTARDEVDDNDEEPFFQHDGSVQYSKERKGRVFI